MGWLRSYANRVLVVLVASTACHHLPEPGELQMRPIEFTVRDYVLPSGLRVVLQEDHSSPMVALVTVVGSGSANDPRGKEGVAHLVEHLTYRAHPGGKSTTWQLLEELSTFNALTERDTTTFFEVGPREALPALLRLAAARVATPLIDVTEDDLAAERSVIGNESLEHDQHGEAAAMAGTIFRALLPGEHPYARGHATQASIAHIELADAIKFTKLYYRPDNVTIYVAGDVDGAAMGEILRTSLPAQLVSGSGPAKLSSRISSLAPEPPDPPPGLWYQDIAGPVSEPTLLVTWTVPGAYRDQDVTAAAAAGLAAGWAERAEQADHDISNIDVDWLPSVRASIVVLEVRLRKGLHPQQTARAVLEKLSPEVYWTTGILLWHAATRAMMQLAVNAEDLASRASAAARFTHFSGDVRYFARITSALAGLRLDRVVGFAKQYLTRQRARVFYVTPAGALGSSFAGPPRLVSHAAGAVAEGPRDPSAVLSIAHAPGVSDYQVLELKNGLEVIVGVRHSFPLVQIGLALHGGTAGGMPRGVVELADALAVHDGHDHGFASEYGATEETSPLRDRMVVRLEGPAVYTPNLVAILADHVGSLRVPYDVLDTFQKESLPAIARTEKRPEAQFGRRFWRALLGNHPYATEAMSVDYAKLGRGDANDWIGKAYDPRNAVVAIVGDISPVDVESLVHEWLDGRWKGDGGSAPPPPPPNAAARPMRAFWEPREGDTQATIVLGCLLPPASAQSPPVYDLTARMIERHLFKVVREKLAVSYGFRGAVQLLRGGTAYLLFVGRVENSGVADALSAIRSYWDSLAAGMVDEAELDGARWTVAHEYNLRFATTRAIVDEILSARNLGFPLSSIDRYPERLARVAVRDVQPLVGVCYGTTVVGLLGSRSVVEPALAQGWK